MNKIQAAIDELTEYVYQGAMRPDRLRIDIKKENFKTIISCLQRCVWRPIETAPDKAIIYVPGTGTGMIYIGWRSANGRWVVFDTGQGERASVEPTHWQPLPEIDQ